ncbi:MAG TPA: ABC transporter permease [Gaiellales bacterium]|nr:ABC transporter permease [Gaiellales bacterium]
MTWAAYRCELRKLAAQRRSHLGLAACAAGPIGLVLALKLHPPSISDTGAPFFQRYAERSGFAVPLLMLLFASIWLFPLVVALVAGDIVAAEDHNRTLKTILTRSTGRSTIFVAKTLAAATYALAAVVVMGVTASVAGILSSGYAALPTFTSSVPPGRAAELVGAGMVVYAVPLMGVVAIGVLLSTVTRNSAAAVVGTLLTVLLMQLTQILPGLDSAVAQTWMLAPQLQAWQALFRNPVDTGPILHAAWIALLYAVVCLVVAWAHFIRRDVTG